MVDVICRCGTKMDPMFEWSAYEKIAEKYGAVTPKKSGELLGWCCPNCGQKIEHYQKVYRQAVKVNKL